MGKMLLIVDAQNDFLEGGSLAVNGGKEKMDNLVNHIDKNDYDVIVFTVDWHPYKHCSFIENGGQWPKHCIQHTQGAVIYQPLFDKAHEKCENVVVLKKGNETKKEEYSIMDNVISSKRLLNLIPKHKIKEMDVCGIAGDYCLKESIDGLLKYGVKKSFLNVLTDFSPSIDDGSTLKNFIAENGLKSV